MKSSEGEVLALEGKRTAGADGAAELACCISGLVVIPISGGYDLRKGKGRIPIHDIPAADTKRATIIQPARVVKMPVIP